MADGNKPEKLLKADPKTGGRRLEAFAKAVQEKFGARMAGSATKKAAPIHRLIVGPLMLDYCLGGGLPLGRIIEMFGDKSAGKSSTLCRIIAAAQRLCRNCYRPAKNWKSIPPTDDEERGHVEAECTCYAEGLVQLIAPKKETTEGVVEYRQKTEAWEIDRKKNSFDEFICAYGDVERAYDPVWAADLGVDNDVLFYLQPEVAEDAIDAFHALIRSGEIDLLAVDSIAQLVPSKETEVSVNEWQQGLQARLMNKAVREWTAAQTAAWNEHGRLVTQVWINQLRCVDAATLVMSDGGVVTAGELADRMAVDGAGRRMVGVTGRLERIGACARSRQSRVRVKGWKGYEVIVGERHPFLLLEDGCIRWMAAKDLKPGSWVALVREMEFPEETSFSFGPVSLQGREKAVEVPTELTPQFAEFLGMWFADGALFESNGTGVLAFTEVDEDRRGLVRKAMTDLFGRCSESGAVTTLNSAPLYRWLRGLGLQSLAENKTVPACIRSRQDWRCFLRGMFDSHLIDCGFQLSLTREDVARQVQMVLRGFGVTAAVVRREQAGWSLRVMGRDAKIYLEEIGFAEPQKERAILEMEADDSCRGLGDVVPNVHVPVGKIVEWLKVGRFWSKAADSLFYGRMAMYLLADGGLNLAWRDLESVFARGRAYGCDLPEMKLLESLLERRHLWMPVQGVEFLPEGDCVDFDMPESETFVAAGFVTHNTKIGVMFGSPDTKPGGRGQDFATSVELKMWGGGAETSETQWGGKEEKRKVSDRETINWKVTKNKTMGTRDTTGSYEQALRDLPDGGDPVYRKGQVIEDDMVFKMAVSMGVVTKPGAKYLMLGVQYQSQTAIVQALQKDVALMQEVKRVLLDGMLEELRKQPRK